MWLRLTSCLCFPALVCAATPQEEIAEKVPAARAILDAWQARNPETAGRTLHVVLWTPADREPAPRYRQRLTAILHDIRDFYAREMTRVGFGPRTLKFNHAADGLIDIHLVRGSEPYAHYRTESGGEIRDECLRPLRANGIEPDRETVVIFCNMANWDPEKSVITQNSPYYAGGSHRSGTAWQVDSPILDLAALDSKEPMVRDGQYGRISIGRYNSIFIGGACHELGHALGLPHNLERADERAAFGTALMGSGNRTYGEQLRGEGKGSFLTLAHALRLASHPMFCGSVEGIDLPPGAVPSDLTIDPAEKGFTVTGRVTADPPAYGVVAYLDPEGGGDYDATTATAVPDKEGWFTLHCEAVAPGRPGELRIVFLQANGVASGGGGTPSCRYPYLVGKDGKADVTAARTRLALAPLVAAVNAGDVPQARELLETPPISGEPRLLEIGKRLAATISPVPAAAPSADVKSVPLSDLPALSEETGYGKPLRDRLPAPDVLLAGGGRVFAHGFYAHAPARHAWCLDGSWKSLAGYAGMADGFQGSVQFIIDGDGSVLWQSPVVKSGKALPFEVELTGVKQLTLRTEDAGDGKREDWALWLEPMLSR